MLWSPTRVAGETNSYKISGECNVAWVGAPDCSDIETTKAKLEAKKAKLEAMEKAKKAKLEAMEKAKAAKEVFTSKTAGDEVKPLLDASLAAVKGAVDAVCACENAECYGQKGAKALKLANRLLAAAKQQLEKANGTVRELEKAVEALRKAKARMEKSGLLTPETPKQEAMTTKSTTTLEEAEEEAFSTFLSALDENWRRDIKNNVPTEELWARRFE